MRMRHGQVAPPTHVCLLLSDHDGCSEMNMNDYEQLLVTRLEEQMFDVSKQYVCPDMISQSRRISAAGDLPIF